MALILIFSVLKIVATLPWIGWIAEEIGKNRVKVYTLVDGRSDPHKVYIKPSMILKLRKADILLYNGLDLEIGYLPYLLEKSGNSKIMPGASGNIDLSEFAPCILEKPIGKVTRAMGDIHPFGNPHYHLDPLNIEVIVDSLSRIFSRIDPENAKFYLQNGEKLKKEIEDSLKMWKEKYKFLEGKKFVSYHKLYEYVANRFGFKIVDYIEPKPGIPPTPGHLKKLVQKIKDKNVELILSSVYYDKKAPEKLSRLTGIKYVVIPHDIGSKKEIKNYFDLISQILKIIKKGTEHD